MYFFWILIFNFFLTVFICILIWFFCNLILWMNDIWSYFRWSCFAFDHFFHISKRNYGGLPFFSCLGLSIFTWHLQAGKIGNPIDKFWEEIEKLRDSLYMCILCSIVTLVTAGGSTFSGPRRSWSILTSHLRDNF